MLSFDFDSAGGLSHSVVDLVVVVVLIDIRTVPAIPL